jgi:TRAP-type mannitol/chloroaromatic compound transport system substrate-binding protein
MANRGLTTSAVCATALMLGALSFTPSVANAQDSVSMTIQNTYPRGLPILGQIAHNVAQRLDEATDGNIRLRVLEPGALVPMLQSWDAVSAGSMEGTLSSLGFWVGKEPGAAFFSSVPFGPDFAEYTAWLYGGGGNELMDEIMTAHNIKSIHCGAISPEGAGWFREPVESVEDFQGLRMRIFGLAGAVMERLGASSQIVAPGDIYPALERGAIDAAEFSMPSLDLHFGYHEVAKHYYFPGWHQAVTVLQLMINLDRWTELSGTQQTLIEMACHEEMVLALSVAESSQGPALAELQEVHGVEIHTFSPEILDALRQGWQEVAEEHAATDDNFARVWESYQAFRAEYKLWRELGYL